MATLVPLSLLLRRVRRHLLVELFLHGLKIEASALLHGREFEEGLEKLHAYTSKNSKDPWLQNLTVTTTYARLAPDTMPTSKRAEAFLAAKARKRTDG